jgi:predicted RNase H-like HicB family nuclease
MRTVAKQVQVRKPISFIAEWTNTGFSAYSKEHPVVTTGATLQELKRNIVEAMNLLLEDDGGWVAAKDILTRPARSQGLDGEEPAKG